MTFKFSYKALMRGKVRRLLTHPQLPYWSAALAFILCLPALGTGYTADDHYHQCMLDARESGTLPFQLEPWELYTFSISDEDFQHYTRQVLGSTPWYAGEHLQARFMRPLSSLTLYFDRLVAPNSALFAHIHSLLWMSCLVLVVGALYRRLFSSPAVAGLATLLFAIEDAHAIPAAWIANRHAIIAITFGALALLCHIRWRAQGARLSALFAPMFLAIGLLASESTLAITPYLFGYAVFLDRSPSTKGYLKLLTLLPYAIVVGVWTVAYSLLGYGTSGSSAYLDPLHDTSAFLSELLPRLSALLVGQATGLSPMLSNFWPEYLRWPFTAINFLVIGVVFFICRDLLRANALGRFFFFGLVLSTLPQCATFPHERMLMVPGIAGLGLTALLLSGWEEGGLPKSTFWSQRSVNVLAGLAVWVNLVIAPVALFAGSYLMHLPLGSSVENGARSLNRVEPFDPESKLVFITGPNFLYTTYSLCVRPRLGLPSAKRIRILSTVVNSPVVVERVDEKTLRLVAPNGFQKSFFNNIMVDPNQKREQGETFQVGEFTVQITRLDHSGFPTELLANFGRDIDELVADPGYAFAEWHPDGYHRFEPPLVGESRQIPATASWQLLDFQLN